MEVSCRSDSTRREGLCSGSSVVLDPSVEEQAESKKLPSSKYKGVVPQPNGRWGAQIYEKHQRVWLGTFNEEENAARVYDVAAQRFRGPDAVTNFKPLPDVELAFLSSHSKAEIVDMLRKHTYSEELQQSRRQLSPRGKPCETPGPGPARIPLFEKVVTPSDVGKLNRLVIPKQQAEKHFPLAPAMTKGVLLNFEDVNEKVWRFRYSYWNSSQSYVLTKGWSRFVKDKGLKPGDVVTFQRSLAPENHLFIHFKPNPAPPQPHFLLMDNIRLFGVDISRSANANAKRSLTDNDDFILSLDLMSTYKKRPFLS